ncbi:MAG: DEAD/DEAH box helicase [Nanoarchaeota archaeon]
MSDLTLRQLRNTNFSTLYKKLLTSSSLNNIEKEKILEIAILFLNSSNKTLQELGYRMVLRYSNKFKNYVPLYDVAINKGYIPITKFIENEILIDEFPKENFFNNYIASFEEIFRKEDIYLTKEQYELNTYFEENNKENLAIVAPTSYGKSELILSTIFNNSTSNICILVPTKSLLAQTRQRIINDKKYNFKRKIITHPEMYFKSDKNFVAVLTQERLLRLLQKNNNLSFDIVIVEEAHNLLENDLRSRLLATSLIILNYRNNELIYKFLTPFLLNFDNLFVEYTDYQMKKFRVEEEIKSKYFYIYNFNKKKELRLYDHFLNKFFNISDYNYDSDLDFIIENASDKNIVYLNKPQDIENLSKRFLYYHDMKQNDKLLKACQDIGEYIHEDYLLIDCLKKGIAYHHGSVPNNIRLFVEHIFSKINEVSYMITTSTLLEGVNIPGEKLFILDCNKGRSYLTHSQFKNLIGRVCRFNEIFNSKKKELDMLEPDIYLVGSRYMTKNQRFLK